MTSFTAGFADRFPSELSGGQQQRVAVARALAFEPPVMLMDEPLGALDKKLREAMQFEIKRIQRQVGATVLYVTHDQEEALTMSDRVAIMQGGNIVQIGAPSSLYHAPATRFVADFVGKMSFVGGEIVSLKTTGCSCDWPTTYLSGPLLSMRHGRHSGLVTR